MMLDAVLEALPDAIAVLDPQGRLLRTNGAWTRLGQATAVSEHGPCEALREGLSAVLSGAQDRFDGHVSFGADPRSFAVVITPVPMADGRGAVVYQRDDSEIQQVVQALRRSEEGLAAGQRIAHFGNWDWNIRDGSLAWSDEIYRIFGLRPQQFPATYDAFVATIHPDDRDEVTGAVARAVHERTHYDIEHRIVLPTGEVRVVHEQGEVQYDDCGEPIRMIGTVHDISQQKRAEQLIREQADALLAATVPLLPMSDDVVVLPLIGEIDSARAERVIATLLEGIDRRKPVVAIIDVTGVVTVDTFTAEALVRAARAARLLGVEVVLTGLRSEVAQAVVALDIDLGEIVTLSSLQRGVAHALERVGARSRAR